jgi:hypothetical protein
LAACRGCGRAWLPLFVGFAAHAIPPMPECHYFDMKWVSQPTSCDVHC